MYKKSLFATATLFAVLGASPLIAGNGLNAPASQQRALNQAETEDVLYMREEEKLARDVYITLYKQWGNPVFTNISRAERRHMRRMQGLIDRYGLVDPVSDDSIGVFVNADLQALYDKLTGQGMNSELDALYVGALIEEVDIEDLQHAIDQTSHRDIERSYENLMRGSRNHLRAFVKNIEHQGISYEAQQLSQETVDLILSESIERGGKPGRQGHN